MSRDSQAFGRPPREPGSYVFPAVDGCSSMSAPIDKTALEYATAFSLLGPDRPQQIIVFPGWGGHVLYARKIAAALDPEIGAYGLRLERDLVDRLPSLTLKEIATHYAEAILQSSLSQPYHLVGYSFAGFLAYEAANELARRGAGVGVLAILDCPVPRWLYWRRGYFRVVSVIRALLKREMALAAALIHGRADALLKKYVAGRILAQIDRFGKADRFIIEHLRNSLLDYEPSHYPGELQLFKGRAGSLKHMVNTPKYLGWEYFARGHIGLTKISGSHGDVVHNDLNACQIGASLSRRVRSTDAGST